MAQFDDLAVLRIWVEADEVDAQLKALKKDKQAKKELSAAKSTRPGGTTSSIASIVLSKRIPKLGSCHPTHGPAAMRSAPLPSMTSPSPPDAIVSA